jgi:hypothetical protein
MWGALSGERTGLSFTIAADPCQLRHSRVITPRDSWPYFTVSDSRLPQPEGPGPCIYISQKQGGPVIPQALGSLFVVPYDSQGYGGGIRTREHTWSSIRTPAPNLSSLSERVRVTLRLAVYRQSVRLGVKPLETHGQNFFRLNTCGHCPYVTSSLTRELFCRLQLLLVLARAFILRFESRRTHDHSLLSQIWDCPNLEARSPYLYPQE